MNTPILKSGLVITWVAIDAITPYENNPRKIPKEAIEKVAASIREFGFSRSWWTRTWLWSSDTRAFLQPGA